MDTEGRRGNPSQLETDVAARRNVDVTESRRNGPQPSTRHDDDDDLKDNTHPLCQIKRFYTLLVLLPHRARSRLFYTNA